MGPQGKRVHIWTAPLSPTTQWSILPCTAVQRVPGQAGSCCEEGLDKVERRGGNSQGKRTACHLLGREKCCSAFCELLGHNRWALGKTASPTPKYHIPQIGGFGRGQASPHVPYVSLCSAVTGLCVSDKLIAKQALVEPFQRSFVPATLVSPSNHAV